MSHFESFLAPELNEYVAYRQKLGYSQWPLVPYLRRLDRYLTEQKADRDSLGPPFFLQFRANLNLEPSSVRRVLSAARVFFQFLVRKGYCLENPLRDVPPIKENLVVPFVFSPQQIDQLLKAVCKRIRKDPRYFLKDLSVYMAMMLLARCGLRISEPLRLLRSHYRAEERTLYIEKTKFKKDRLIPIPKAAAVEIENYLAVRKSLLPQDQNPHLFAYKQQGRLRHDQLYRIFRLTLQDIGLDQPRRVIANMNFSAPTPHSLRHSFAIDTLKRVKQRAKSPQNALPVLATYMGHSLYKHTTKYLKFLDAKHRWRFFHSATSVGKDT
jgi:site-specific recombinase XerD